MKKNRRQFLQESTVLPLFGLPILNCFLNSSGDAFANGTNLPNFYLLTFFGMANGYDGLPAAQKNLTTPTKIGTDYDLTLAMAPIGSRGLISDISVITGLEIPYGPNVPGGWSGADNDFHIEAMAPLLTGMRQGGGPALSSDGLVAAAIGAGRPMPLIACITQAAWYLGSGAPFGRDIISYRSNGRGGRTAVAPTVSPAKLRDDLFAASISSDPVAAAKRTRMLAIRSNILKLIEGDRAPLLRAVDGEDRITLEKHFDEVNALQKRVDLLATQNTVCGVPTIPQDPPVGGARPSPLDPFGVNQGYSDELTRGRLQADLIAKAFECNLTAAVSWIITMAQSHMNAAFMPQVGGKDVHDFGHGLRNLVLSSQLFAWHLDFFCYLAQKLKETRVGAGVLLDQVAMVATTEGGCGGNASAPNGRSTHSTENMALFLAGRAGGLVPGQHLVAPANQKHPGHVINTALTAVGVTTQLGEVSGIYPQLFGA